MIENDPLLDAIKADGEIKVIGEEQETPQSTETPDQGNQEPRTVASTEEIANQTSEGGEENPNADQPGQPEAEVQTDNPPESTEETQISPEI